MCVYNSLLLLRRVALILVTPRNGKTEPFSIGAKLLVHIQLLKCDSSPSNILQIFRIIATSTNMSAEKRPASNSFSSSQLVKRQRSNSDLRSDGAIVSRGQQNGALVQSVSQPSVPGE